jgi:DnaJ-class molecular chaperone
MKKEIRDERFDPGKYGMRFCPSCHGVGHSAEAESPEITCHVCGGFGWIRREFNSHWGAAGLFSTRTSEKGVRVRRYA